MNRPALALFAPLLLALAGCTAHAHVVGPVHLGLCGAVLFAGDVWACYHVWMGRRSNMAKLLWTLGIFFFPVGGLLLFWVFGDRKISS
jgi:hypothetical protein